MSDASALLNVWTDPTLGEFVWVASASLWRGTCEFNGRVVELQLVVDNTDPSPTEQVAVFEPARRVLPLLLSAEPEFRRLAAGQIGTAVVSQQPSGSGRVTLPEAQFADGLELLAVSLHGCGELHYRSAEFFPDWLVTIYFDEELVFDNAEVYPPPRPV